MSPGCSRLVSAQPEMALCVIQYEREVYAFCHPQSPDPAPNAWGRHRQRDQVLGPAVPTLTGSWEKWTWLVFSEPRSRGGAGRWLPRSQGRAPASSPPPPEGWGTKVLCTSRNHLITSSLGLGTRGSPTQNGGVRRRGTGINPKVGIELATAGWGARGEGVSQEAVGSFPRGYPYMFKGNG